MTFEEFKKIVADTGLSPVPEKFHPLIKNVAFLIEEDVSEKTRHELNLPKNETLLGLYRGVPHTERNDSYGQFGTLPDTITLYYIPILQTAAQSGVPVKKVIEDTIWHEVAHHFGLDENQVELAERRKTNH